MSYLKDSENDSFDMQEKRSNTASPSVLNSSPFGSSHSTGLTNSLNVGASNVPLAKPKKPERGISGDTTRSGRSSPRGYNSEELSHTQEEIVRAIYFVSQVCEYSFYNAAQLYEDGLMRIMINQVRNNRNNVEIQRQALRSISAMCPVLSSITPGGHPAQVVEKLKSVGGSEHVSHNQPQAESTKKRYSNFQFV
jgi:hypothetical protein